MAELVKVVVDAMGGDNAPGEIVKGAVEALTESKDIFIYLLGMEEAVKQELSKYTYDQERVEVVACSEVIEIPIKKSRSRSLTPRK